MDPLPKKRLHRLVDDLPEQEIQAAERYLQFLCEHDDPLTRAMRSAPDVQEPFTEAERQGVEDAIRDLEAGNRVPHARVLRKFGL